MLWAERNLLELKAVYLPGHLDEEANYLSQNFQDSNEWSLHPSIFSWIMGLQNPPEIDLFASTENAKLPRFLSRLPNPRAE